MKPILSVLALSSALFFSTVSYAQTIGDLKDGIALFQAKKNEQARLFFEAQNNKGTIEQQAKILFYLARLAQRDNDFEQAEDYFEQSLKLNPEDANSQTWYGVNALKLVNTVSIFSKMSYADKATEALTKALSIEPNHLDAMRY